MNTFRLIHTTSGVVASILIVVLSGCVSTPPPKAQMAVAEAAIQHANTSSTSENAPGELQIAIAKLASAQQAETNKDYERAIQLAQEADVDAQVAEMHAQSARARIAAQESLDAARVLREEINRQTVR
jgi:hypothetical protein